MSTTKAFRGFIPARKKGKLPYETIEMEYDLEQGTACIEIHSDCIKEGMNVLIHDDLLATGGTANAMAELVKKCGATTAGFSFFISLDFLNGQELLAGHTDNFSILARY